MSEEKRTNLEKTKVIRQWKNKEIKKVSALEKKLFKVIKRECLNDYRADTVAHAISLLAKRLQLT